ncbi:MAG: hypothetical protein KF724_06535 [Phycisphaeraceae bacterium]|nr:hypothetical protein [Phycisphaeraceae bacterium]
MPSVEERLDRLEASLRLSERRAARWRAAALGVIGAGTVAALGAMTMPSAFIMDVVRTTRLEIIGAEGKPVLVATAAPSGGQIDLWSRSGANTMRLGASDFGGDLVLWNEKGEQAVSAYATADGGRFESFWADGKPGFLAGVSREHGAAVSIVNAAGREVLYAGSNKVSAGLLRVADRDGAPSAAIVAAPGGGVFEAFASGGPPVALIGAGDRGQAGMIQISVADSQRSSVSQLQAPPSVGGSAAPTGAAPAQSPSAPVSRPIFEVDARVDGSGRAMIGAGGDATIILEAGPQHTGLLSFFSAGTRVAALGSGSAGGQVNLFSLDGRPALVMGAAADGQGGAITVRGGDGNSVVRASVDPRGDGEVAIYSANGQRKRVLTSE